jgi:glutaconate CoA-transferase subunit A
MQIVESGIGTCKFSDPDDIRDWMREKKSKVLENKLMSEQEAVAKFVHDGDYLAFDLSGMVRGPSSLEREIVRQKKRNLFLSAKFGFLETAFLVAGGCVDRIDCGFMGGGSANLRAIERGEAEVTEWSNGSICARFLAGSMGLPFIPWRGLMGTDTFEYSSAKIAIDPFSGKRVTLLPALNPDVAILHVNQCDIYGNARIFGPGCIPVEVATASKRVIISTEEIIDIEAIRKAPSMTAIPFYLVDAVVLAPYGAHPGCVPGLYDNDWEHLSEFFKAERNPDAMVKYLDKYVFDCKNHEDYLNVIGEQKLEDMKKGEIREGYYE